MQFGKFPLILDRRASGSFVILLPLSRFFFFPLAIHLNGSMVSSFLGGARGRISYSFFQGGKGLRPRGGREGGTTPQGEKKEEGERETFTNTARRK